MRRNVKIFSLVFVIAGIVAASAGALGYYAHKLRLEPIYNVAERLEVRLRRDFDLKSDTQLATEEIRTLFLTLNGRVHIMPDRNFGTGGALSSWNDDLLILHGSGKVFWLGRDEEEGMVLSRIAVPDNGLEGYVRLAAEKYPGRNTRADGLRYNDIEFIDAPGLRGLLLSYTFVDVAAECYRSRLSWLAIPDNVANVRTFEASADDWDLVFETSPCLPFNPSRELIVTYMAGGRIAFKEPNLVYLGSGEYHLDGIYRPDPGIQTSDSDYGKVLEINLETRNYRHFSVGHRNLQGMVLDANGEVWTTEHGMRGGDELNLILDGENYGWPIEDMGTLYNGIAQDSPSGPGRHRSFRAPVYAWVPSAAVSSLALVDGFHPAWDGDLLVGSLKERTLYRARIHEDRLVSLEPIPIGQRIRDVMQWGPDRIALWLDLNEVVVLEIEPTVDPLDGMVDKLAGAGIDIMLAQDAVATLQGCAECHAYHADIHGAGPSLAGIVGRPVAGSGFGGYSDALRFFGGTWTRERLTTYLAEPEALVEGTHMTGLGVNDPDLAAATARALELLDYIQQTN